MKKAAFLDRAAGAIVGAFVGDALGMGVHWYYNLDEMRSNHGDYVKDYTDPVPGRYHDQLKAGEGTQASYILKLMLASLVKEKGYNEEAFCKVLDEELFPLLDGSPAAGPGGYTSQSIRHAYNMRKAGVEWGQCGSPADTTESIERNLTLGVLHALQPTKLAETTTSNTILTQTDEMIACFSVAFNATLAQMVRGAPFDENISDLLMEQVKTGELPFHVVTQGHLQAPRPGDPDPPHAGRFASPDALLTPWTCAVAAKDSGVVIEPAWKVSLVYGLPCAAYHVLPATYYLSARFPHSFEEAVLSAVNGGGQNCARAMLTGALMGAQVGLSNIPTRFIDGLKDKDDILKLSKELAELAAAPLADE